MNGLLLLIHKTIPSLPIFINLDFNIFILFKYTLKFIFIHRRLVLIQVAFVQVIDTFQIFVQCSVSVESGYLQRQNLFFFFYFNFWRFLNSLFLCLFVYFYIVNSVAQFYSHISILILLI